MTNSRIMSTLGQLLYYYQRKSIKRINGKSVKVKNCGKIYWAGRSRPFTTPSDVPSRSPETGEQYISRHWAGMPIYPNAHHKQSWAGSHISPPCGHLSYLRRGLFICISGQTRRSATTAIHSKQYCCVYSQVKV